MRFPMLQVYPLLLLLSACATIVGGNAPQIITVNSNPDQAKVSVQDLTTNMRIFQGSTPAQLILNKKARYLSGKRYLVTIEKEGYVARSIEINPRANGWYIAGNLVFGGLIGWLIIDPNTGAMWTLTPSEINQTLVDEKVQSKNMDGDIVVVLLPDVPHGLAERMVPLGAR